MKNEKQSKIRVSIKITDFECSHDEITAILEMNPTRIWKKGELISKTIRRYKENGWQIITPCDEFRVTLEEQVSVLLELISPRIGNFRKLPYNTCIELSCVIYAYDERPIIGFSAESIKKLAEIGASIDVDSYDLTSLNDE